MVVGAKVGGVRLLELLMAILCLGLHYHSFECPVVEKFFGSYDTLHRTILATATFSGFAILAFSGLLAHLFGTPPEKRADAIVALVAAGMFIGVGAWILQVYKDAYEGDARNMQLGKATASILTGAVFLAHSVLALLAN